MQAPPAIPDLKKEDVHWKWTNEAEVFVVQCFAQFMETPQIVNSVIENFGKHLRKDIAKYGIDAVRQYLRKRVRSLQPAQLKTKTKRYLPVFEGARKEFLQSIHDCYLAHRRNRVEELDQLYRLVVSKVVAYNLDDGRVNEFTALVKSANDLLREARVEMSDSKVNIEASVEDGNAKLSMKSSVDNLTDEQIEELLAKHERGEPITIPNKAGNGAGSESGTVQSAPAGTRETESGDLAPTEVGQPTAE